MKAKTINISLPQSLYEELKKKMKRYHYSSASELIRDALRWWMNPRLTRNGFTPEFEEEILKAAAEPIEDSVEWDGKTPFAQFVISHPPKHAQNKVRKQVLSSRTKTSRSASRIRRSNFTSYPLVSQEPERYATP